MARIVEDLIDALRQADSVWPERGANSMQQAAAVRRLDGMRLDWNGVFESDRMCFLHWTNAQVLADIIGAEEEYRAQGDRLRKALRDKHELLDALRAIVTEYPGADAVRSTLRELVNKHTANPAQHIGSLCFRDDVPAPKAV